MRMPAAERGVEVVLPEMNQRSSVVTARRKTRLVVRRGRMGIRESEEGLEGWGLEREKRSWGGAKRESVPVPVRSGRCSPRERMSRIRLRYWCSSWLGFGGAQVLESVSVPFNVALACSLMKWMESPGGDVVSTADGAMVVPMISRDGLIWYIKSFLDNFRRRVQSRVAPGYVIHIFG